MMPELRERDCSGCMTAAILKNWSCFEEGADLKIERDESEERAVREKKQTEVGRRGG